MNSDLKQILKDHVDLKGRFDTENSVLTDSLSFEYEDSGFRANAGVTFELAVVRLKVDYAFQEYETLTIGFGISIR